MIKHFFTSIVSILLTTLFFCLVFNSQLFGQTPEVPASTNNQPPVQMNNTIDEDGIYLGSHFSYKNWKSWVVKSIREYETGSTFILSNHKKPVFLFISDDDSGNIQRISLNDKTITCNPNRIIIAFKSDASNDIDSITVYDGDTKDLSNLTTVTLKKANGIWRIVKREKNDCTD